MLLLELSRAGGDFLANGGGDRRAVEELRRH
jgi:hypothetical protein